MHLSYPFSSNPLTSLSRWQHGGKGIGLNTTIENKNRIEKLIFVLEKFLTLPVALR